VGKTTVCRRLLDRDPALRYSVSCTTRPPRPGEADGRHYFFVSAGEFERRARGGGLLEWALVHGHRYGTPKAFVKERLAAGEVVLAPIDVQGAAAVRRSGVDSVGVFLLPPSWESLRQRLGRRGDAAGSVEERLRNARAEMGAAGRYEYWVVNDRLPRAVAQIEAIIAAERQRAPRVREALRLSGVIGRIGRELDG
jgi:guanylate kinase